MQRRNHGAGVGVESVLRPRIPHVTDRRARDIAEVDVGRGGHLAGEHDEAGGQQRLARDPAAGILLEHRIEDRVRNLVRDLVRMSFGDRFGGEDVSPCPAHVAPSC